MMLKAPARALSVMIYLGGIVAVSALFNIVLTLALFGASRMFAVVTNILVVIGLGGGSVLAWLGLREYRAFKGKVLPWVAIVFPTFIPILCLGGLPISIWAGLHWLKPEVVARRRLTQNQG
jgi:hypothetical protein